MAPFAGWLVTKMPIKTRLLAAIIVLVISAVACGCSNRLVKHNGSRFHIITAQDFAQILLAHCESGIQLSQGIETVDVSPELKRLASTLRADEQNDRPTITAWIAKQTTQSSMVGKIRTDEIRSEHSATIEQLRRTAPPEVNRYAWRVIETHLREQLAFLRETPVEDKELRDIADAIWQRTSLQLKEWSQRPPT